ncbi:DUF2970 domain-containing protein [Enterovibrio paralichthyis]|uniref:DUF2970 domain-containing protein n=1 Tax=Enterovibrio paralichthyis TaxID=2853805 RepID=UPI001C47E6C6|nr:DUF2970 domain-containing protein [Enterovibrio paralichthyis]MBV7298802.1 DUF2970 domain-containing protein [Enterovibrio paralichthyis]
MQDKEQQEEKVGLLGVVKSVVAAMFGVQSDKNRQRDFRQTSMVPYLLVGFVFVVLFVVALIGLVSLVAPS